MSRSCWHRGRRAARFLPFLDDDEKDAGLVTLLESAWRAGDMKFFDAKMKQFEDSLGLVGSRAKPLYSLHSDRAGPLLRWAKLTAESNDLDELWSWWNSKKLFSSGLRSVVALAIARHLIESKR